MLGIVAARRLRSLLIGFVIFVALILLMGALGGVGVIEMELSLAVAVIAVAALIRLGRLA